MPKRWQSSINNKSCIFKCSSCRTVAIGSCCYFYSCVKLLCVITDLTEEADMLYNFNGKNK